jgi:hypothetical protein
MGRLFPQNFWLALFLAFLGTKALAIAFVSLLKPAALEGRLATIEWRVFDYDMGKGRGIGKQIV